MSTVVRHYRPRRLARLAGQIAAPKRQVAQEYDGFGRAQIRIERFSLAGRRNCLVEKPGITEDSGKTEVRIVVLWIESHRAPRSRLCDFAVTQKAGKTREI